MGSFGNGGGATNVRKITSRTSTHIENSKKVAAIHEDTIQTIARATEIKPQERDQPTTKPNDELYQTLEQRFNREEVATKEASLHSFPSRSNSGLRHNRSATEHLDQSYPFTTLPIDTSPRYLLIHLRFVVQPV